MPAPMPTINDVAEYILDQESVMTCRRLHTLLYYSQAWHLAWSNEMLFDARCEAWAGGPVFPELYALHEQHFHIAPGCLAMLHDAHALITQIDEQGYVQGSVHLWDWVERGEGTTPAERKADAEAKILAGVHAMWELLVDMYRNAVVTEAVNPHTPTAMQYQAQYDRLTGIGDSPDTAMRDLIAQAPLVLDIDATNHSQHQPFLEESDHAEHSKHHSSHRHLA